MTIVTEMVLRLCHGGVTDPKSIKKAQCSAGWVRAIGALARRAGCSLPARRPDPLGLGWHRKRDIHRHVQCMYGIECEGRILLGVEMAGSLARPCRESIWGQGVAGRCGHEFEVEGGLETEEHLRRSRVRGFLHDRNWRLAPRAVADSNVQESKS